MWGGAPIGVRRLTALVKNLSPRAAVWRELHGGADWGTSEEMLATLVELTDAGNRLTFAAGSGKKPPWKAVKVPRPRGRAARREKREQSTPGQLRRFFGGSVKVDRKG